MSAARATIQRQNTTQLPSLTRKGILRSRTLGLELPSETVTAPKQTSKSSVLPKSLSPRNATYGSRSRSTPRSGGRSARQFIHSSTMPVDTPLPVKRTSQTSGKIAPMLSSIESDERESVSENPYAVAQERQDKSAGFANSNDEPEKHFACPRCWQEFETLPQCQEHFPRGSLCHSGVIGVFGSSREKFIKECRAAKSMSSGFKRVAQKVRFRVLTSREEEFTFDMDTECYVLDLVEVISKLTNINRHAMKLFHKGLHPAVPLALMGTDESLEMHCRGMGRELSIGVIENPGPVCVKVLEEMIKLPDFFSIFGDL